MRDRRTAGWVLALALPLVAAGCGDDGGPPPAAPSPTEALWNPCDALDAKGVGQAFGASATEHAGTADVAVVLVPAEVRRRPGRGRQLRAVPRGPGRGLGDLGRSETATVTTPKVRGADDTRLVVDSDAQQLYVSGFVQNGDLIQTVDAVDPKPFDRRRVVDAVTWALGELSAHAQESGVS